MLYLFVLTHFLTEYRFAFFLEMPGSLFSRIS